MPYLNILRSEANFVCSSPLQNELFFQNLRHNYFVIDNYGSQQIEPTIYAFLAIILVNYIYFFVCFCQIYYKLCP